VRKEQCSMSQHEDSFRLEFEVANAVMVNVSRSKEAHKQDSELGLGVQKNTRRSACEELTQCDYSKIETVRSNCKFRPDDITNKSSIKSRTTNYLTHYQPNTSQYYISASCSIKDRSECKMN
jgi:hypothetical protein